MEVLFGLGTISADLSVLAVFSNGEPGYGGLEACTCICGLLFAPLNVAAGIFCMVGLEKWNLIASIFFNALSILLHAYLVIVLVTFTEDESAKRILTK